MPRDIVTILGELSALPIVFPDVEGASGKDYVDLADALFLPGGQDVDPTLLEKNRRGKWAVRITRWTALKSISFGPFMRQENPFWHLPRHPGPQYCPWRYGLSRSSG